MGIQVGTALSLSRQAGSGPRVVGDCLRTDRSRIATETGGTCVLNEQKARPNPRAPPDLVRMLTRSRPPIADAQGGTTVVVNWRESFMSFTSERSYWISICSTDGVIGNGCESDNQCSQSRQQEDARTESDVIGEII